MEKNKEITGSIWNKDNVQNISTITIRVCGADKGLYLIFLQYGFENPEITKSRPQRKVVNKFKLGNSWREMFE